MCPVTKADGVWDGISVFQKLEIEYINVKMKMVESNGITVWSHMKNGGEMAATLQHRILPQ